MNYSYDKEFGFWKRPSSEAFTYSDGDAVERRMLSMLNATKDRSALSPELIEKINDWPTRYHLHPSRANLLRPFEALLRGASVLELGGGCGALTRYLGETCARVTMVEGSARRCAITASRCRELRSVSVYCDTILQAEPPKGPFDVVTLIGVLEYARVYETACADPIQAVLKKARSLLKPGGALILALENQLGLKYLAGTSEDHCGEPMVGINDAYQKNGVVTFGVREMTERLKKAGFASLRQYLPFPDYKLPTLVIHPEARGLAPSEFNLGALLAEGVSTPAPPWPYHTFSLEQSWGVVARNGLAWDLCNSLCFVARTDESPLLPDRDADGCTIIASHYSTERKPHFAKRTRFVQQENTLVVRREALIAAASDSVLQNRYPEEEAYRPTAKYSDELCLIVNRKDWTAAQIAEWNLPLLRYWEKRALPHEGKASLPSAMMDCIARNVLCDGAGELRVIDQEWSYGEERIPLMFLVFYNLIVSLQSLHDVAPPAPGTPLGIWALSLKVLGLLGLDFPAREQEDFSAWLKRFHAEATGFTRTEVYKTIELAPRYTMAELLTYVNSQAQKIRELQGQVNGLAKERDMLTRVIDKHTRK